jgi:ATP-binding cassette subfamily F protein uup
MARIERRLEQLTTRRERLHADLAARATEHEEVLRLDDLLRELRVEQDRLERQWMTAAEQAG